MALFTRPTTAKHRTTTSPTPRDVAIHGHSARRDAAARMISDLAQGTGGAQTAAILALAHLHTEDAPAIQWTLGDDALIPPRLEGLIHPRTTDPDRHQHVALAAWQRVIGAGPVQTCPARSGGQRLTITGSYMGIAVHVTTTVTSAGSTR